MSEKPPKLIGLSKRPRKVETVPEPPEGFLWCNNKNKWISALHQQELSMWNMRRVDESHLEPTLERRASNNKNQRT